MISTGISRMLRLSLSTPAALFLFATIAVTCSAQDTKYPPAGQQIPSPECLTMRGASGTLGFRCVKDLE